MDPLLEIKVGWCCAAAALQSVSLPLYLFQVGNDVSLKSLARSVDPDTPTLWYAQDAGGGIWKTDIVVSHTVSCLLVHAVLLP